MTGSSDVDIPLVAFQHGSIAIPPQLHGVAPTAGLNLLAGPFQANVKLTSAQGTAPALRVELPMSGAFSY